VRVLVTGATGFLGRFLCRRLKEAGYSVVELNSSNCDLTKSNSLEKFDRERFHVIYHLAAWTQAGDFCLYHPGEQWVRNQLINSHVLDWWQRYQPQAKLICMGTSCAYPPDMEHVEGNYLVGEPIDSLFTYAMTKRMLYIGLIALNKQFGLKYLYLVPSTLYGPEYHTDGRQMHFIFDLVRKILKGKLYGEPVVLWGDGYQKREVIYVDDFVDALLYLSEKVDNEIVNVGSGEELTIREFAKLICDIVDFDFGRVEFDRTRYVGAKSKCLDVGKLKMLMPHFRPTPLVQGVERTVRWFLENKDKVLI